MRVYGAAEAPPGGCRRRIRSQNVLTFDRGILRSMTSNGLARFRANPRKVRVSIRRCRECGWVATVEPLPLKSWPLNAFWSAVGDDPEKAVMEALERASEAGVDGVDVGMDWAYPHPWAREVDFEKLRQQQCRTCGGSGIVRLCDTCDESGVEWRKA